MSVAAEPLEGGLERLRLRHRAREAVEDEPVAGLVAVEAVHDHADDQLVGHEVAAVHVLLGLPAELRLVLHRLAQDVAGREVGKVEVVDQPLGLGALPGPGRAEQDEVQLAHREARGYRAGALLYSPAHAAPGAQARALVRSPPADVEGGRGALGAALLVGGLGPGAPPRRSLGPGHAHPERGHGGGAHLRGPPLAAGAGGGGTRARRGGHRGRRLLRRQDRRGRRPRAGGLPGRLPGRALRGRRSARRRLRPRGPAAREPRRLPERARRAHPAPVRQRGRGGVPQQPRPRGRPGRRDRGGLAPAAPGRAPDPERGRGPPGHPERAARDPADGPAPLARALRDRERARVGGRPRWAAGTTPATPW